MDISPQTFHASENSLEIIKDKEGRLSLNALWKSAGSPEYKRPYDWLRLPDTEGFIDYYNETHTTVKSRSIKTKEGKGGGTFAMISLASY